MKRKLAGLIGKQYGRLGICDANTYPDGTGRIFLTIRGEVHMVPEPDLIALARAVVEAAEPEAERTVEYSVIERLQGGGILRHYSGDLEACRACAAMRRRSGNASVRVVVVETTTVMREVEDGVAIALDTPTDQTATISHELDHTGGTTSGTTKERS
jgi:hypothetical protein